MNNIDKSLIGIYIGLTKLFRFIFANIYRLFLWAIPEVILLSIKKIADLANVSVSTVSKVLTNRQDISEQTRQEILKIMDEVNYRPKRTRNRLDMIACVFDDGLRVSSNFGGLLLDSLTRTAFLAGYRFTLLPYDPSFESRGGLMQFLRSTGIAGMVALFTNERKEDFYKALLEVEIPHIVLPLSSQIYDVNSVEIDNAGGGLTALSHLAQLNHRRICVIGSFNKEDEKDRLHGALQAFELHGLDLNEQVILDESKYLPSVFELEVLRYLKTDSNATAATAVFCTNYLSYLNILKIARDAQITVPTQLSLIGFGDYEFTPLLNPPLTTISVPVSELGQISIEKLLRQIKNGNKNNSKEKLPVKLIVRQSTMKVSREGS